MPKRWTLSWTFAAIAGRSAAWMPSCPRRVGVPILSNHASSAAMPSAAVARPNTCRAKRSNWAGLRLWYHFIQAGMTTDSPAPWGTLNSAESECSMAWFG